MTASLLAELERAWKRSDELFGWLAHHAWHARPIPLRHPFVFYLGHLPAFAWNQVGRGVLGEPAIDDELDLLFERGIDPLDGEEAAEAAISQWPEIPDVIAYRDRARRALREVAGEIPARDGDPLRENARVLELVIEHELMHHETLLYMLQALERDAKRRPEGDPPVLGGTPPEPESVEIPPGRATIGTDFESIRFGWDNEFPRSEHEVPAFEIDRFPVTVAAYWEFVDAGGYLDERFWDPADFAWLRGRSMDAPHDWHLSGGLWMRRTMFDSVPIDALLGWPAVVSFAEASAYARWRGRRLPTEEEVHRAALGTPGGDERRHPWGDAPPGPEHGNFGQRRHDPVPVGTHPAGASAFGVEELVGNGWEWTSTPFVERPGFVPWMRTYPGYSSDFFDGEHFVLFGASWATAPRFLRPSFRNWFQRRYPWVFASFRTARSSEQ